MIVLSCSKIIQKLHWLDDEQEGGRNLFQMFNNAVKFFLAKKIPLLMLANKTRSRIGHEWREYWEFLNHHGQNQQEIGKLTDDGFAAIECFLDNVWSSQYDCITGVDCQTPLNKNGLTISCRIETLKRMLGTTLFAPRGTEVIYLTLAPIQGGRYATLSDGLKLKTATRYWAFKRRFGKDPAGLRVFSLTTGRSVYVSPHETDLHGHLYLPAYQTLALLKTRPGENPLPVELPAWAQSHNAILWNAPSPIGKVESLEVLWRVHEAGVQRARSIVEPQLALF